MDLFKLAEPKISEISLLTRFLATYLDANFSFLNGIKALINSLRIADLGFVAMLIILLQGDKKSASEKIPYRICATVCHYADNPLFILCCRDGICLPCNKRCTGSSIILSYGNRLYRDHID